MNFFTSFGYFREDGENARVLEAISRALRPGGRFLMDYLNRAYVISTLVPSDRRTVEGMEVEQRRWITGDPSAAGGHVRINKQVRIREDGAERSYDESVRMYTLVELEAMMDQAGLVVTQTYGDFDGRPVTGDAPRNILVGPVEIAHGCRIPRRETGLAMSVITLLTDFGLSDSFVGTMKGVILGICPGGPDRGPVPRDRAPADRRRRLCPAHRLSVLPRRHGARGGGRTRASAARGGP